MILIGWQVRSVHELHRSEFWCRGSSGRFHSFRFVYEEISFLFFMHSLRNASHAPTYTQSVARVGSFVPRTRSSTKYSVPCKKRLFTGSFHICLENEQKACVPGIIYIGTINSVPGSTRFTIHCTCTYT